MTPIPFPTPTLPAEAADTGIDPRTHTLRLFRRESPVRVLGPGARAVVWVQGCAFSCPGCIVPESWDAAGGYAASAGELADWVLAQGSAIDGLTVSGGEPMLQAAGVAALIDRVRARRDLGVVCYTGYAREHLERRGTSAQHNLLARVDLLIDGPYVAARHAALLWRGSSNQRLHLLTPRYAGEIARRLDEAGDASAGVEIVMDAAGAIGFAGVPAQPGFRDAFVAGLRERGIRVAVGEQAEWTGAASEPAAATTVAVREARAL